MCLSAQTLLLLACSTTLVAFSFPLHNGGGVQATTICRRSWFSKVAEASAFTFPVAFSASAARADDVNCVNECMKECTKIAPGEANKAYCRSNCEDYCKGDGPTAKGDVVRQDLSE
uniref:Uncharacterized protein n=1 Tax=Odontella aurita TaxID=265563 RepID=A0A7S4IPH5_9STRA|mmetsp:Transcript_28258/g.83230  ORF Transcript_28258/g.83230 Transcript_28258/m.83230 type:complete len:116 (+) Transcript_28258:73-420(+)|eukprot:CAMPEP_0113560912 /NCGR_PEP_ID=MMETSP0015_2-20120614/19696_1 /TAXON_ID=2838 /ORGANISM="Odontella" /LENGTH=115 /DNA_ID=CAMNT_0000462673 /DNA_START=73 /DNA_END=420 /DNA_ORIENTATION=+ /assembly_acc=CAM_ASM_000160